MRAALLADDWNEVTRNECAAAIPIANAGARVTTPQMERLVKIALANVGSRKGLLAPAAVVASLLMCRERKAEVERPSTGRKALEILNWKFSHEGLTVTES